MASSFPRNESESMSKSKRLRELIAKGAIMLPGVPNAAMARQVERLGFDAVYVSGAGMANATAGVPDNSTGSFDFAQDDNAI